MTTETLTETSTTTTSTKRAGRPKKTFDALPLTISYVTVPFPDRTGLRGRPRSDSHVGVDLDACEALIAEHGVDKVLGHAFNLLRAELGLDANTVISPYKDVFALKTKTVGKDILLTVEPA